ncbi:histidine phosphatase family protein [Nocardioides sp.]|uniref:histidine phosphatase family protein n=1 Tax=Nocardioides sp. TaxID=35761 RepID=UPI002ED2071C
MTDEPPEPTTVVLVRHGVTEYTTGRRFSGGLGGHNPALSEEGRAQIGLVAEWLSPLRDRAAAVVTSPVRRTRESAELLGEAWGVPVVEEPSFAEMEFGAWEGLTFDEVGEQNRDELLAWFESVDARPGGTGESFRSVEERVLAGLDRLLTAYRGQTVVVVSHVTPIKTLVTHALEAPTASQFRLQLTPGSVTVLSFRDPDQPGPPATVRLLNALPPPQPAFLDHGGW